MYVHLNLSVQYLIEVFEAKIGHKQNVDTLSTIFPNPYNALNVAEDANLVNFISRYFVYDNETVQICAIYFKKSQWKTRTHIMYMRGKASFQDLKIELSLLLAA